MTKKKVPARARGGLARAAKMTPEELRAASRRATVGHYGVFSNKAKRDLIAFALDRLEREFGSLDSPQVIELRQGDQKQQLIFDMRELTGPLLFQKYLLEGRGSDAVN